MKSGKVGLTVQTPVGKAAGLRTFDEIKSGAKPPADDKPPVVTKPMPGGGRTAAAPPVDASPEPSVAPAKPDESALAPTAKPKPRPKPAASGGPEAKAKRLLRMGKNYLRSGMTAMAKKKFQEIVTKYPDTNAAAQAKEHLAD